MALGAIGLGLVSAISGGLGAIGQQQDAEAQYRQSKAQARQAYTQSILDTQQANATRQAQYRGQKDQWKFGAQSIVDDYLQDIKIYDMKGKRHNFQVEENSRAASDAYYRNNVRLNEIVDRSKGAALDSYISMLEANAESELRGQSGRRSGMRKQANLMARGIEMRRRADNLSLYARDTTEKNKDVTRRLKIDNQNSYFENVAIAPQKRRIPPGPMPPILSSMPMQPIMPSAPSRMGMYGSLLSSAVGGITTAASLMPEGKGFLGRKWG